MTSNTSAVALGKLYTVAAPSGVGKTTLVKALLGVMDNLQVSVSYTTRPPRPGEVDGINYHFVTESIFKQMIATQDFLEYALVFDHYYGTSSKWVKQQLAQGINVILEIDWQGVRQIKRSFPDCVRIFILPPSLLALKQRLETRAQDSVGVIEERMDAGKAELSHYDEADFLVVNNNFSTALRTLCSIIKKEKLPACNNMSEMRHLAQRLLMGKTITTSKT